MSHTTTIKSIVVRSPSALRRAVEELQRQGVQCALLTDTKPGMYYNNQEGVCDYVLSLEGAIYGGKRYDIGFKKQDDGTYATVFDDWGHAISGQVGAACPLPTTPEGRAQHAIGKVLQEYGKYAAIEAATAQGYVVTSTTKDAEGNYHLEIAV